MPSKATPRVARVESSTSGLPLRDAPFSTAPRPRGAKKPPPREHWKPTADLFHPRAPPDYRIDHSTLVAAPGTEPKEFPGMFSKHAAREAPECNRVPQGGTPTPRRSAEAPSLPRFRWSSNSRIHFGFWKPTLCNNNIAAIATSAVQEGPLPCVHNS